MSAQFISRNPFFFFLQEIGNHTSNKNKLVNNFRLSMKKNYKNFRNFMIKNCFSYNNKVFLPFKKIFTKLKRIFYMFCTRQRQHFTKNT